MKMPLTTNLAIIVQLNILFLILSNFSFTILPTNEKAVDEEICDNGIDDDEDGLIDLNDPDCICEVIESISLIPNPSFEDTLCCPSSIGQLDCAVDWVQASEATTDFLHTCGWMGWEDLTPPMPFPDGEAIIGFRDGRTGGEDGEDNFNWKEYAGACLLSPLLADSTYRFEFEVGFLSSDISPPINISFFGSDCAHIPFGVDDAEFGCPTNGQSWLKLGSRLVYGGSGNKWVKVSLEITPDYDIPAIAIGPDCPIVETNTNLYYFFDNLILADTKSFDFQIQPVSHPCKEDFSLQVPFNSAYTYQWYKEGVALVGETANQLTAMYGEGVYQVRIKDAQFCRVSPDFTFRIPLLNTTDSQTICHQGSYIFGSQVLTQAGNYVETFTSVNNCDSIVYLELSMLEPLSDTISVQIFEGEDYSFHHFIFSEEGNHLANIPSQMNCDSLVQVQLTYYKVFIPNVFSPNYDGINDYFTVFEEEEDIESIDLTIYDRWGAQIFNGLKWDGRYRGKMVNPGSYIYVLKLRMDDEIERNFGGSVLVLR